MKFLVPLLLLGSLYTCFTEEKIECGTRAKGIGRIVGGTYVPIKGLWPWQAALTKQWKSERYKSYCSAIIIKPNWILTAAHCVHLNPFPMNYVVIAGAVNLTEKESGKQEMDVSKIIIHPKYDKVERDYDLALLKLTTNIKFNDNVRPICLPKKRFPDGENCYSTGWGALQPHNSFLEKPIYSSNLKQLLVPLVSDKECQKQTSTTPRMICGGHKEDNEGTCAADSGGPLSCMNKSGVWELAGVASFVIGRCATKHKYDFYVNMVVLKGWVEDQMKNYECSCPK